MANRLLAAIVFALPLLLIGCKTTPIPEPVSIPVPEGLTNRDVQIAILAALSRSAPNPYYQTPARGGMWFLESSGEDVIYAGYEEKTHYLRVAIAIDAKDIQIQIVDSKNLNQSRRRIHRSAERWLLDLQSRLRRALGEADAAALSRTRSPVKWESELDPFLESVVVVVARGRKGSAFRVSTDGRYLTNWHVVEGSPTVSLILRDKEVVRAQVVGTDRIRDIALLKGPPGGPHLSFRDSAYVGEEVWAIGAPFEFPFSVSRGVVSAFWVQPETGKEFIQTDAAVNPGNSGGPLIATEDGRVLGMNTMIRLYSEGLNFAVPARDLQEFLGD